MKRINLLIFEPYPFNLVSGNLRTQSYILKLIDRNEFNPILLTPFESEFTDKVRKQGFECIVVKPPQRLVCYGGKCIKDNLPGKFLSLLAMIPYNIKLWRVIKKENIDVIYCNCVRGIISIGLAAKLSGTPLFLYIKGELQNRIIDWASFVLADRICFFCEANKNDKYPKLIEKYNEKIGILKIGLDPEIIIEIEKKNRENLVKELDLDHKRINLVYSGLFTPLKGIHYLLEALTLMVKDFPQVKLYIVGDCVIEEHKDYKERLENIIKKNKLENNVFFTGWRKDVLEIVSLMDILVHPSLSEGFGRTVLEGMALGKAVVASKVGGLREIIKDGENGFLVEPGKPEELANKLSVLLEDENLRNKFGKTARKTVFSEYLIQDKVRQFEQILKEISKKIS